MFQLGKFQTDFRRREKGLEMNNSVSSCETSLRQNPSSNRGKFQGVPEPEKDPWKERAAKAAAQAAGGADPACRVDRPLCLRA